MTPTLYCLMREDLQDLNPGKAMAQAMHAQADFDRWVEELVPELEPDNILLSYVNAWKEDRSFGRTLVVSVTLEQIISHQHLGRPMSGITVDPTYPWRNFYGKVFLTNEITCAWAFACDATPQAQIDWLKSQSLHP